MPHEILASTPLNDISTSIALNDNSPTSASQNDVPTCLVHNVHFMITRSKLSISKPKLFTISTSIEPTTIKQALIDPHWFNAMQTEYNALNQNGIWTLTNLPQGATL